MASVSLLYIDDPVVGPHLELLRNICEPESTSKPHVTVRYYDRLARTEEHLQTTIDYIDLVGIGVFSSAARDKRRRHTVYISCASEELLSLEHKPHYPLSELHITLVESVTQKAAAKLVKALGVMDWRLRVPLPAGTHLTLREINRRSPRRRVQSRAYSTGLSDLFREATGKKLRWSYLAGLSWGERLVLVEAVCRHLQKATSGFERFAVVSTAPSLETLPQSPQIEEPEVHITPPELARSIASFALALMHTDTQIHFGDPAVGNGAFFSALKQLVPPGRIGSAIGIEISHRQAVVAAKRWSHAGLEVRNGDYLHMERLPLRNLILANPPYLRHQKIPSDYKLALRERASVIHGRHISGRSGQYVYFLLLGHSWLVEGGVAAWLVPSEFMQTAYGSAVRHYLTHDVQLIRVHQFGAGDPQFENAKVMPSVVVFRKASAEPDKSVELSCGGSLHRPEHSETVPLAKLRTMKRWFIPTTGSDVVTTELLRIGQLFSVQRGIATGANEFFVLERSEASKLGIPQRALRPVLPKARTLASDIVEAEDDGYPSLRPQLVVIDCDMPMDQVRKRYPRFHRYLKSASAAGILRRRLVRSRTPWYKQEKREPPPFLCTYMGRGREGRPPLRFIWNKSEAIATNTYLMLYPRPPLARALADRPELAADLFDLLREAASHSVTQRSRVHAEGLRKIEPGELMEVHLPRIPDWLPQVLDLSLVEP